MNTLEKARAAAVAAADALLFNSQLHIFNNNNNDYDDE